MTTRLPRGVAELVRQARDPEARLSDQHLAFTALVERFEDAALATALGYCHDVESARDACQEAFLLAWRLLPRLREPAAFGGWLKRLVRTQCARGRRRQGGRTRHLELEAAGRLVAAEGVDATERLDRQRAHGRLRRAVRELPPLEREAVIRFYFLGEPLEAVGRALGIGAGRAGKQVYTARLRLRRRLPRSVALAFLRATAPQAFARRVAEGVFDEFVGEYRFPDRPQHRVVIRRERDRLVAEAGGQRHLVASCADDALRPAAFDGEARFRRDRAGRIVQFVYYEFGRRLGVARKLGA